MPRYEHDLEGIRFSPHNKLGTCERQERPRGYAEHATDCSNRLPHETGIPLAVDLAPGLELLGSAGLALGGSHGGECHAPGRVLYPHLAGRAISWI